MTIPSDVKEFEALVSDVPHRENEGQPARQFFEDLLASSFAIRRRTGVIQGRNDFLDALIAGGDRRFISPPTLELVGAGRIIVRGTIAMTVDGVLKHFDNLQLCTRDSNQEWKMIAWANEELAD